MVQGTTSVAAWGICQGGFGVIASENDQGWFGKGSLSCSFLFCKFDGSKHQLIFLLSFSIGIYLTSSIEYASRCAQTKIDGMNKGKELEEEKVKASILICATIPGNTFRLPDMSLNGKPVRDGYQSHFTIGLIFSLFIHSNIFFQNLFSSFFFFLFESQS